MVRGDVLPMTTFAHDATRAGSQSRIKDSKGCCGKSFKYFSRYELRVSFQHVAKAKSPKCSEERPAAQRVFAQKAVWLRCSSVEDPRGIWASQALPDGFPKLQNALARNAVSFIAPRHTAFCTKTAPLGIFNPALSRNQKICLLPKLFPVLIVSTPYKR